MKILIGLIFLFLVGCSKPDFLVCQKSYYVDELGKRIDVTTTIEFKREKMEKYTNRFVMELKNEEATTIETLFQSMKQYYEKDEEFVPGVDQTYEKGEDYISYQIVYDMNIYGSELSDYWGNKEEIKYNLENDSYLCE